MHVWWFLKESNLTATTPHIEGNGFTDRRGEQEPINNTNDQIVSG
jgi:hypothetical protein